MITRKLRTLIVEDDLDHQRHLEKLIEENHPELHLMGSCSSGTEALSTIKSIRPELIMMDIDLRDMNAFEMLEQLHETNFHIFHIFSPLSFLRSLMKCFLNMKHPPFSKITLFCRLIKNRFLCFLTLF